MLVMTGASSFTDRRAGDVAAVVGGAEQDRVGAGARRAMAAAMAAATAGPTSAVEVAGGVHGGRAVRAELVGDGIAVAGVDGLDVSPS